MKVRLRELKLEMEGTMKWTAIAGKYGYQTESYQVETYDGYLLTLFRIPGKLQESPRIRPPVLLWHGMASSGVTWLLNGDNSPAFILAEEGYDVWMGNTRGNSFSRRHRKLDPDGDENEFWDFTFEKAGKFDISAAVFFINKKTGMSVPYIGHSGGTT